MLSRIVAFAALLLLLLSAAAFAGTGGRKAHASRRHRPAPAASQDQPAPAAVAAPAPVRRRAYVLNGRLFENLSFTDADGTLHIWIEDLGMTDRAGFDTLPLYLSLTDFGYGGSARQLAADLGSRRAAPSPAGGQQTVPAPGPPTPGKWVDQFGREIGTEE
jgi:hypothetical protein